MTTTTLLSLPWVAGRITVVTLIWTASSLSSYEIQRWLGNSNGYNDAPFLFAGWYAGRTVFVMLTYRRAYLDWATAQLPPADWLPRIVLALAFGWFAVWGLRLLPAIDWPQNGALHWGSNGGCLIELCTPEGIQHITLGPGGKPMPKRNQGSMGRCAAVGRHSRQHEPWRR